MRRRGGGTDDGSRRGPFPKGRATRVAPREGRRDLRDDPSRPRHEDDLLDEETHDFPHGAELHDTILAVERPSRRLQRVADLDERDASPGGARHAARMTMREPADFGTAPHGLSPDPSPACGGEGTPRERSGPPVADREPHRGEGSTGSEESRSIAPLPPLGPLKVVFGPVPSRRLGRSLGVDPVPSKVCNLNCVYCQLGRTHGLTVDRREYLPVEGIVDEIEKALETLGEKGRPDWVTFCGSGEPTLHTGLGRMIREVKTVGHVPVAVITNGSMLHVPEVRDDLIAADAVLPSVDAGSEPLYRKINRPHPQLTLEKHLSGLRAFRREYPGKLWVEVMLLAGINDGDDALEDLAEALVEVRPDRIDLNTPVRPPAESWALPVGEASLARAAELFRDIAPVRLPGEPRHTLEFDPDDPSSREARDEIDKRHPTR